MINELGVIFNGLCAEYMYNTFMVGSVHGCMLSVLCGVLVVVVVL